METRCIRKEDLQHLKAIINTTNLFPSAALDEMMSNYFDSQEKQAIWLTSTIEHTPVGLLYCAPERLTDGTFNIYLIAVHSDFRNKGIGKELMANIEKLVKEKQGRILIVETSSSTEYEATRGFYKKINYTHEATIREFYSSGEDKIVFWKRLVS